jgi:DNA adenine methylase
MTYPGGKNGSGVYQRVINQIPPHDVFVSAFLGDCAVLRHKRPAAASVGIDLDEDVLRTWCGRQIPGLQLYHCCGVEWLRFRFNFHRFVVPGRDRQPPDPESAAAVAEFGVDRSSGGRSPTWFVYCDPPYPLSTRVKQRVYKHEMTFEQHEAFLRTVISLPAGVLCLVHSYPSPMYGDALQAWRTFTYRATTRGGTMRDEQVWCNYPEPSELHDYRYLGRNKREREKIRRRVNNWTAGVARMPELERLAIVQALNEVQDKERVVR